MILTLKLYCNLIIFQKKIINNITLDSGLRMSSLNESPIFGDLFLSNQRDVNLGSSLRLRNHDGSVLNFSVEQLFSLGEKKLFFENFRIDFPDPFSIKMNYKNNSKINYSSEFSIDLISASFPPAIIP